MDDTRQQVRDLVKSYPVLSEEKLERRIDRLKRMQHFYEIKAPDAPEGQSLMFAGFISALAYAMTIIAMYRKLTQQLAEIAKEDEA